MTREEILELPAKECTKCHVEKARHCYYVRVRNGLAHSHSECKECTKRAKRIWTMNNMPYVINYMAKDSIKTSARKAVLYALKTGKLKREKCVVCGSFKTQAHHSDYSNKLDVIWVCQLHHVAIHRESDDSRA